MPEFPPQTINAAGAIGDAQLLAEVLCKDLNSGTLLDIGCGSGLIAVNVALRRTDINILGIDLDIISCSIAQANIGQKNLTDRIEIICADVFKTQLPTSDAVCCNPPLLPDEQGFFAKDTPGNLFWKTLIEKIDEEKTSPSIYFHLFDFHGINHRTGELPCLEEIANSNDFSIATLYRGVRQIGENSRIRHKIPELADFFPEGIIVVDDLEVPIHKFPSFNADPLGSLFIYQSIVRLSR